MTLPPATHDGFRPTQCRAPTALAWVRDDPGASRIRIGTALVRCKSWREEGCGRWLRQLHGQLIEAGFDAHPGAFARFVTVTWPTDTGARLDSADDCAKTTRMFRLWVEDVRRHFSPPLHYYVVKEPTRRGRLHLHAVTFGPYLPKCRRTLPPGCLLGHGPDCHTACDRAGGCREPGARRPPCVQEFGRRRGLGWIDIRVVRGNGRGAAAYIGKYLGKDHIGRRWPRHSRRSSYSRGFAPTTIRDLAAAWSERAYRAGVEAGHIIPEPFPAAEHTRWRLLSDLWRRGPPAAFIGWLPGQQWAIDLETGTVRHLGSTQSAALATGEVIDRPWSELSPLAYLRRLSRRVGEQAAIIGGPTWESDLTDPQDRRQLLDRGWRAFYASEGMTDPQTIIPPRDFTLRLNFPERPPRAPYTGDPGAPFE